MVLQGRNIHRILVVALLLQCSFGHVPQHRFACPSRDNSMLAINYIIATWPGNRHVGSLDAQIAEKCSPTRYLRLHLQQLLSLNHSLAQITIIKPEKEITFPREQVC